MSRQANGSACTACATPGGGFGNGPSASNYGNISTYTVGFRYNPFMTTRAGFAWHNEYNWLHQDGTGATLGTGTVNVNTSEVMTGFDFDF
jgi:hypothetical protein